MKKKGYTEKLKGKEHHLIQSNHVVIDWRIGKKTPQKSEEEENIT